MESVGTQHVVLIPVKPPGVGKTRLVGVPPEQRTGLATAFAIDTVTACLATPGVARVLVTTDDADFAHSLTALGADACPDGGSGLNPALVQAAAEAARRWPELRPVALCADLPALRPVDLATALASASGPPSYVADAGGTGTTLYTAAYDDFDPHFGIDSAAAHSASGARAIAGDLPGLRHDVDDLDSLRAAVALGVGAATRAAAAALKNLDGPLSH
ncbi:2-phospho-L-lactate guanylyltransferase [Nocardioides humilatus]|uniref:2-phospho-L-lactate guanylyltransferase n=1 Tax=Nocardioides humilatus TaxID=2607660 RepID=A0A5B1LFX4_9ACTN|nr:2-phospho-L-lactate guanylyltransferase [Nocardioides humilatus]KAA1418547.1 2-phospho-L-lactate guanylyltransferase [Nocardioides humilatus]